MPRCARNTGVMSRTPHRTRSLTVGIATLAIVGALTGATSANATTLPSTPPATLNQPLPPCYACTITPVPLILRPSLQATINTSAPGWRIAANSTRHRAYVTTQSNPPATVTTIDTAALNSLGTVSLGGNPEDLTVKPNTSRVYVQKDALGLDGGTVSMCPLSRVRTRRFASSVSQRARRVSRTFRSV